MKMQNGFRSVNHCIHCGSTNLGYSIKGDKVGLYCIDCGKWIKWLPKDENLANYVKINVDNQSMFNRISPAPAVSNDTNFVSNKEFSLNCTGEVYENLLVEDNQGTFMHLRRPFVIEVKDGVVIIKLV